MRYFSNTIITLSVLISGFAFAAPAFAQATCPRGTAYADGCSAASGSGSQYSFRSDYVTRPPWNVAGVDYLVGVPTGQVLKNPASLITSPLPGTSYNGQFGNTLIVTGSNVVIDGYDFSLGGGWQIDIEGGSNTTIQNNRFRVQTSAQVPVYFVGGGGTNVVQYNTFDGNNGACPSDGRSGMINMVSNQTGTFKVWYNFMENACADFIDPGGNITGLDLRYNFIRNGGMSNTGDRHPDFVQLGSGNLGLVYKFNTFIQDVWPPQGGIQGASFGTEATGGTIRSVDATNNVTLSPPSATPEGMKWAFFMAGAQSTGPGPYTFTNNYTDPRSFATGYVASSGGTSMFTISGNINMVNGATCTGSSNGVSCPSGGGGGDTTPPPPPPISPPQLFSHRK